MQPLSQCPPTRFARVRGVLTDIDDTLTTHGQLTALAYSAMESIHQAGVMLIPITGRPAGWCDHIARMWPVDAVVGENGAFWFRYEPRLALRSAAPSEPRSHCEGKFNSCKWLVRHAR